MSAVLAALALGAGPAAAAAGCANAAAVLRTHAMLRPGLSEPQRVELRARAVWWADLGLRLDGRSTAALKQRGLLAADARDFEGAARLLAPAFAQRPADQSLRKALGYAELWSGRVEAGVGLLSALTYVGEVRKELAVWPVAWRERRREDLARRAEQAAAMLR